MKLIPLIVVALLPSVLLAGVIESSVPADADSFIRMAWQAMGDSDYLTAYALFDCALRRVPLSLEALAGRALAEAFMKSSRPGLLVAEAR